MSLADLSEQVLIPPEDLRQKIEKVVRYVARNPSLETKLLQAGTSQTKDVSFLQPGTPYFAYYNQKLYECRQMLLQERSGVQESGESNSVEVPVQRVPDVVESPPTYNWILGDIFSTLSVFELELMKLVAQFVSCNGRACQMGVWNRESKNPQFSFLQPLHPYNSLYQTLLMQYMAIPNASIPRASRMEIYRRIQARRDWKYAQLKTEADLQAEEEEKRTAIASIDWDNAIIVDTIQFLQNEVLPPPIDQKHVGFVYQSLKVKSEEMEDQTDQSRDAMDVQVDVNKRMEGGVDTTKPSMEPINENGAFQRVGGNEMDEIEKYHSTRISRSGMQVCPICRQEVPVDEIAEHMKVEFAQSAPSKTSEKVIIMATGEDIYKNLSQMAESRSDIFDVEENRNVKSASLPLWNAELDGDGGGLGFGGSTAMDSSSDYVYAGNSPIYAKDQRETKNMAMRENNTAMYASKDRKVKDSRNATMKNNDSSMMAMGTQSSMNPPYPYQAMPSSMFAPTEFQPGYTYAYNIGPDVNMKRMKIQETIDFIPEKDWIASHPDPVIFHVEVSEVNNLPPGTKTLDLQVSVDTTIKDLKENISKLLLNPLPPNKQALKAEKQGFFLKDKHTVAYYNLLSGTVLVLSAKERGGRKK